MSARVRFTIAEIGHHGKVEVQVGDDWIDISHVVQGVETAMHVGDLTRARLDVVRVEAQGVARVDAATMERLAELVDEHRARGWLPTAET